MNPPNPSKNYGNKVYFLDIQISAENLGKQHLLNFYLEERPRLSKFKFEGVKKSDIDAIRDKIKLVRGKIIENIISNTKNIIRDHYIEKGFFECSY